MFSFLILQPQLLQTALRTLALDFGQQTLADADCLRGDLDQFIIGDELDRRLQGQLDWWHQANRLVSARGADVGKLLALDRVAAGDCYRFCLSSPHVDVVLNGPANEQQLDENLAAVEKGPLSDDEMRWMRDLGKAAHG